MRKPIDLEAWAKRNARHILSKGLLNSDPNDDDDDDGCGGGHQVLVCPKGIRLSPSEQAAIDTANAHVRELIKKEKAEKK